MYAVRTVNIILRLRCTLRWPIGSEWSCGLCRYLVRASYWVMQGCAKCWFVFLSPYSPDLDAIDMAFSKFKVSLRRIGARIFTEMLNAHSEICYLRLPNAMLETLQGRRTYLRLEVRCFRQYLNFVIWIILPAAMSAWLIEREFLILLWEFYIGSPNEEL